MAKDYYNGNDCFDAMRSVLTPEELRGFCVGSAFKYIWRHHSKGGREDLEKAADYLNRALKLDEPEQPAVTAAEQEETGVHGTWLKHRSGTWIKRRIGYVCPFCGAQAYEPADTCYKCGASLDEPNDGDDRPVNVGKTGVWVTCDKIDGAKYGCPFCGQTVTFKDEDRPETLTCPRCLAVLSFEEEEQDG